MTQKNKEMDLISKYAPCYRNIKTEIEKLIRTKSEVKNCFEREKINLVQIHSEQYNMLQELLSIAQQLRAHAEQNYHCSFCNYYKYQVSICSIFIKFFFSSS